MAYQRAKWCCPTVNITQGYGITSSSHKKGYPLDNGGIFTLICSKRTFLRSMVNKYKKGSMFKWCL